MTKKVNREGIRSLLEKMPESCDPHDVAGFDWSSKGIGFGQMSFYVDNEDGYVHCHNEGMGREFLKKILCHMVDNCVLNDMSPELQYPPGYEPHPIKDDELPGGFKL